MKLSKRSYEFHEIIRYDENGNRMISVSLMDWDGDQESDLGKFMEESMKDIEKVAVDLGFILES